jgi:hypothetical protein
LHWDLIQKKRQLSMHGNKAFHHCIHRLTNTNSPTRWRLRRFKVWFVFFILWLKTAFSDFHISQKRGQQVDKTWGTVFNRDHSSLKKREISSACWLALPAGLRYWSLVVT